MLLGLTGPSHSGKGIVAKVLCELHSFHLVLLRTNHLEVKYKDGGTFFDSPEQLLAHVMDNLRDDHVTIVDESTVSALDTNYWKVHQTYASRPFYYHVAIDSSLFTRYQRLAARQSLAEAEIWGFAMGEQNQSWSKSLRGSHLLVDNNTNVDVDKLGSLIKDKAVRLLEQISMLRRPAWDAYFLKLVQVIAERSSCAKRKVGCLLVTTNTNRIVSTGYNGTPVGIPNCSGGGCSHCVSNIGHTLNYKCLCVHAEENALFEAGRRKILQYKYGNDPVILYTTTCPCIGCAKKIIQAGVQKVVYIESYHNESTVRDLFKSVGISFRQAAEPSREVI